MANESRDVVLGEARGQLQLEADPQKSVEKVERDTALRGHCRQRN